MQLHMSLRLTSLLLTMIAMVGCESANSAREDKRAVPDYPTKENTEAIIRPDTAASDETLNPEGTAKDDANPIRLDVTPPDVAEDEIPQPVRPDDPTPMDQNTDDSLSEPTPLLPQADAGADQSVSAGQRVLLDARSSRIAAGIPVSFAWMQRSGPAVTLSSYDTDTAEFVAPHIKSQQQTLTFELAVTQIEQTDRDEVTITITATDDVVEPAPVGGGGGGGSGDGGGDGGNDQPDPCLQDSDGDSVGDCEDECPSDPSKTHAGVCGCGVPDSDHDLNGVLDCLEIFSRECEPDVIVNGQFETPPDASWELDMLQGAASLETYSGTFTNSLFDPGPMPSAFSGARSAVLRYGGEGPFSARLVQPIRIPATFNSPTLRWADAIRSFAGFAANQSYSVSLWESCCDGNPLEVLYTTAPSNPPTILNDWALRSVSLQEYKGRKLDLVFQVTAQRGPIDLHLDAVNIIDDCNNNALADPCDLENCLGDQSCLDELDADGNGALDACEQCPAEADLIGTPCDSLADADRCATGVYECTNQVLLCNDDDENDDRDGDGAWDCEDLCPDDPNKTEPGLCGCGSMDLPYDSDGDGVLNCLDSCPYDANKVEPGYCGCGISDDGPDTDADGYPDHCDNCADHANPDQTDCDADGLGDLCQLLSGAPVDEDDDGVLDVCQRTADQPDGWLVLYNLNNPDSITWKNWYLQQWGIPHENALGLDVPNDEKILESVFENNIRIPVRNYLSSNPTIQSKIMGILVGYRVPGNFYQNATVPMYQGGGGWSVSNHLQNLDPGVDGWHKAPSNPHKFIAHYQVHTHRLTKADLGPHFYLSARIDAPTLSDAIHLTTRARSYLSMSAWELDDAWIDYDFTKADAPAGDEWSTLKSTVLDDASGTGINFNEYPWQLPWRRVESDRLDSEATPQCAFRLHYYRLTGWHNLNWGIGSSQPGPRILGFSFNSWGCTTLRSTTAHNGRYVPNALFHGTTPDSVVSSRFSAAIGATGEPFGSTVPDASTVLWCLKEGYTLAEAFFHANGTFNWMWEVVGDPLLRVPAWFDDMHRPLPPVNQPPVASVANITLLGYDQNPSGDSVGILLLDGSTSYDQPNFEGEPAVGGLTYEWFKRNLISGSRQLLSTQQSPTLSLPPDTYYFELRVTDEDGDVDTHSPPPFTIPIP